MRASNAELGGEAVRTLLNMSSMMTSPIQKAEKLPATKPDRMFSEAPPCLEQLVTSRDVPRSWC